MAAITTIPPAPHVLRGVEQINTFYSLQSSLRSNARPTLLDAGCGEGRHTRHFASLGYRVLGIDTDIDALQQAAKMTSQRYLDEGIVRYDLEDVGMLRLKDPHFDGVLCTETLQLFPVSKRQHVLEKLMQITRSGGFHLVSSYVGPAANGTSVRPVAPHYLKGVYEAAGWDVIHHTEDPYNETEFGGKVVVNSIASVVATKP